MLLSDGHSRLLLFDPHRVLIDFLEKPGTQDIVCRIGAPDDLLRKNVDFHGTALSDRIHMMNMILSFVILSILFILSNSSGLPGQFLYDGQPAPWQPSVSARARVYASNAESTERR